MTAISAITAQSGRRAWPRARTALWVWVAVIGIAITLGPLVQSMRYVLLGAVTAAVVLGTSVALRVLRVPPIYYVPVQLLVLIEWATLTFFRADAWGGVVPVRRTAAAAWDAATATLQHSQAYPAPVPRLGDFDVTLALGVGLVAILVDLIAVSLRRAPLVGLVFLAIYMAPVSLLSGHVSMWAFIPGALGYVFLLAATEREKVLGWGRGLDQTGAAPDSLDRGGGLEGMGRRAGLGAVACAVVIPLFVPTMPTQLFGDGGTDGEGGSGGSGPVSVRNPILDMRRNLTSQSREPLISVTTPDGEPSYLRLTSLPELTAAGWAPGERSDDSVSLDNFLPGPPGVSSAIAREQKEMQVNLLPTFSTQWLPTLYAPTTIRASGPWALDPENLDIVNTAGEQQGPYTYQMNVSVSRPDATQLRASSRAVKGLQPQTRLPEDVPAVLAEQAEEVTAGAKTDFDRAVQLQNWFRTDGDFTYDLSADPTGGWQTLADFVTTGRRGYCEQFATAMAIMARTQGIPARVAVGFLRPQRESDDTYVFRGTDSHAWPELYLTGAGWVRFEPTPGGAAYSAPSFAGPGGRGEKEPTGPTEGQSRQPRVRTADPSGDAAAANDGGNGGAMLSQTVLTAGGIMLAIAAVAAIPWAVRGFVRRRRWSLAADDEQRAEAIWAELRDRALDLGISWDDATTPRRTGEALRRRLFPGSAASEALAAIVLHLERTRYSSVVPAVDLRSDLDKVGDALAAGRPASWRWRARLFPTSWLRRVVRPTLQRPGDEELLTLRG